MNDPAIDNTLTLESVQEQFESWRLSRTKRGPIPEILWEAAVKLCLVHPRTRVCRILRLFFPDLKRRLSTAKTTPVHTCQLAGVNPLDCLTWLLKNGQTLAQSPDSFLPWNYGALTS
jgi:hypothetical protein